MDYRLFRVDLMVVNIQRALGIDSAGYLAWNGLCTRHSLHDLVYYRYLKVALMVLDSVKALGIDLTRYNKGH